MNIAALIIAVSLLASRVLGVLREMLLARTAGVALEKSALDLAFLIPDILNHVVSTGFLSIVFIPIFTVRDIWYVKMRMGLGTSSAMS